MTTLDIIVANPGLRREQLVKLIAEKTGRHEKEAEREIVRLHRAKKIVYVGFRNPTVEVRK